jgi:hypothetical protein
MGTADRSRQTLAVLDDHDGGIAAPTEEASRRPDQPHTTDEPVAAVECVMPVSPANIEFFAAIVADDDLGDERAVQLRALAMQRLDWPWLIMHLHGVLLAPPIARRRARGR